MINPRMWRGYCDSAIMPEYPNGTGNILKICRRRKKLTGSTPASGTSPDHMRDVLSESHDTSAVVLSHTTSMVSRAGENPAFWTISSIGRAPAHNRQVVGSSPAWSTSMSRQSNGRGTAGTHKTVAAKCRFDSCSRHQTGLATNGLLVRRLRVRKIVATKFDKWITIKTPSLLEGYYDNCYKLDRNWPVGHKAWVRGPCKQLIVEQ